MNAPLTANALSPEALPMSWMNKLFLELHGRFGNEFTGRFATGIPDEQGLDSGVENAKATWARRMAGLNGEQIQRGLASTYKFPPSADDFVAACQGGSAAADAEALYYRAATEMGKRRAHAPQNWPSPPLYWAAVAMGSDILTSEYRHVAGRWKHALEANKANMAPIPDVAPDRALPAPQMDNETAKRRIRELGVNIGGGVTRLGWAERIAKETAAGTYHYSYGQRQAAEAFYDAGKPVPECLVRFLVKTKPMEEAA